MSTILGLNYKGTCLICSVFMSKGKGNLRFKVKNGLFGLFSCYKVRVLSSDVTGGKRSTDFPVNFATQ